MSVYGVWHGIHALADCYGMALAWHGSSYGDDIAVLNLDKLGLGHFDQNSIRPLFGHESSGKKTDTPHYQPHEKGQVFHVP